MTRSKVVPERPAPTTKMGDGFIALGVYESPIRNASPKNESRRRLSIPDTYAILTCNASHGGVTRQSTELMGRARRRSCPSEGEG